MQTLGFGQVMHIFLQNLQDLCGDVGQDILHLSFAVPLAYTSAGFRKLMRESASILASDLAKAYRSVISRQDKRNDMKQPSTLCVSREGPNVDMQATQRHPWTCTCTHPWVLKRDNGPSTCRVWLLGLVTCWCLQRGPLPSEHLQVFRSILAGILKLHHSEMLTHT